MFFSIQPAQITELHVRGTSGLMVWLLWMLLVIIRFDWNIFLSDNESAQYNTISIPSVPAAAPYTFQVYMCVCVYIL